MDTTIFNDTLFINSVGTTAISIIDTLKTIPQIDTINTFIVNEPKSTSLSFQYFLGIFQFIGVIVTFSVALIAISGNKLKFGPKLEILDHNFKGDLTILRPDNKKAFYYHFKIDNLRKSIIANNVRLIVTKIERRIDNNTYQEILLPTCPQFQNTPAEIDNRTPDISDFQIVDFGRIVEGDSTGFTPMIYRTPNNFQGFVGQNESVRYTIKILSDNYFDRKEHKYEVSWNGIWIEDIEEMQKNLIIKRI